MNDTDPRARLLDLAAGRHVSLAQLSALIGRNTSYLQQFVRKGSPRRLEENDRRVLARRATSESSVSTIENLNQRVNAWWGMVIIFFVSYQLGGNATVVLFAFISLFALREFITLTPTTLGDHNALFSAFFILIPLQYLLIGTHWYSIARHMLGLRNGLAGARRWRQVWSNHQFKQLPPSEVMRLARTKPAEAALAA